MPGAVDLFDDQPQVPERGAVDLFDDGEVPNQTIAAAKRLPVRIVSSLSSAASGAAAKAARTVDDVRATGASVASAPGVAAGNLGRAAVEGATNAYRGLMALVDASGESWAAFRKADQGHAGYSLPAFSALERKMASAGRTARNVGIDPKVAALAESEFGQSPAEFAKGAASRNPTARQIATATAGYARELNAGLASDLSPEARRDFAQMESGERLFPASYDGWAALISDSLASTASSLGTAVVTRSPSLALGVLGAQSFGAEYESALAEAQRRNPTGAEEDWEDYAFNKAFDSAVIEVGTSVIPVSTILGRGPVGRVMTRALERTGISEPMRRRVSAAAGTLLTETAQEALTPALGAGADVLAGRPVPTAAEVGRDTIRGAALGAISAGPFALAPMLGSLPPSVQGVAERLAPLQAQEQAAPLAPAPEAQSEAAPVSLDQDPDVTSGVAGFRRSQDPEVEATNAVRAMLEWGVPRSKLREVADELGVFEGLNQPQIRRALGQPTPGESARAERRASRAGAAEATAAQTAPDASPDAAGAFEQIKVPGVISAREAATGAWRSEVSAADLTTEQATQLRDDANASNDGREYAIVLGDQGAVGVWSRPRAAAKELTDGRRNEGQGLRQDQGLGRRLDDGQEVGRQEEDQGRGRQSRVQVLRQEQEPEELLGSPLRPGTGVRRPAAVGAPAPAAAPPSAAPAVNFATAMADARSRATAPKTKAQVRVTKRFKSATGSEIILVDGLTDPRSGGRERVSAFYHPEDKALFVDSAVTDRELPGLVWHEFSHSLRDRKPELWSELKALVGDDVVRQGVEEYRRRAEQGGRADLIERLDRDAAFTEDEGLAQGLEDLVNRADTPLSRVLREKLAADEGLLKRVVEAFRALLRRAGIGNTEQQRAIDSILRGVREAEGGAQGTAEFLGLEGGASLRDDNERVIVGKPKQTLLKMWDADEGYRALINTETGRVATANARFYTHDDLGVSNFHHDGRNLRIFTYRDTLRPGRGLTKMAVTPADPIIDEFPLPDDEVVRAVVDAGVWSGQAIELETDARGIFKTYTPDEVRKLTGRAALPPFSQHRKLEDVIVSPKARDLNKFISGDQGGWRAIIMPSGKTYGGASARVIHEDMVSIASKAEGVPEYEVATQDVIRLITQRKPDGSVVLEANHWFKDRAKARQGRIMHPAELLRRVVTSSVYDGQMVVSLRDEVESRSLAIPPEVARAFRSVEPFEDIGFTGAAPYDWDVLMANAVTEAARKDGGRAAIPQMPGGWRLRAHGVIEQKVKDKMRPSQVIKMLQAAGLSEDEMKYSLPHIQLRQIGHDDPMPKAQLLEMFAPEPYDQSKPWFGEVQMRVLQETQDRVDEKYDNYDDDDYSFYSDESAEAEVDGFIQNSTRASSIGDLLARALSETFFESEGTSDALPVGARYEHGDEANPLFAERQAERLARGQSVYDSEDLARLARFLKDDTRVRTGWRDAVLSSVTSAIKTAVDNAWSDDGYEGPNDVLDGVLEDEDVVENLLPLAKDEWAAEVKGNWALASAEPSEDLLKKLIGEAVKAAEYVRTNHPNNLGTDRQKEAARDLRSLQSIFDEWYPRPERERKYELTTDSAEKMRNAARAPVGMPVYAGEAMEEAGDRAWVAVGGGVNYRELLFRSTDATGAGYKAPHFGMEGKGLAAHMRVSDFFLEVDRGRKRVMVIQEMQSDLHQAAREQGYVGDAVAEVRAMQEYFDQVESGMAIEKRFDKELDSWVMESDVGTRQRLSGHLVRNYIDQLISDAPVRGVAPQIEERGRQFLTDAPLTDKQLEDAARFVLVLQQAIREREVDAQEAAKHRLPDVAFKKTWPDFLAKVAVQEAVLSGADFVAWSSGDHQIELYGSSVERLHGMEWYADGTIRQSPTAEPVASGVKTVEDLVPYVGRDVAEQWAKLPPTPLSADERSYFADPKQADALGERRVLNREVKFGGKGMRLFYDVTLPSVFERIARRNGAKITKVPVKGNSLQALEITDKVREEALRGYEMFGRAALPRSAAEVSYAEMATPDGVERALARGAQWFFITSDDPKHPVFLDADVEVPEAENARARLLRDLRKRYGEVNVVPGIVGRYGGPDEDSVLVLGAPAASAVDLLKKYGQDAAAGTDGMVYHDQTINPRVRAEDKFGKAAVDGGFYSLLPGTRDAETGERVALSLGFDFGTRVPLMQQDPSALAAFTDAAAGALPPIEHDLGRAALAPLKWLDDAASRLVVKGVITPVANRARAATVRALSGTTVGDAMASVKTMVQSQVAPQSMIPEEAARAILDAKIRSAYTTALGVELSKVLRRGGESQLGEIVLPKKHATPQRRRDLWEVLNGRKAAASLPAEMQPVANKLLGLIDRMGQSAVAAGLMSQETYDQRRGAYLPYLYAPKEEEKVGVRGVLAQLKMNLDRFKPRLSDSWAIIGPGGKPISDPARKTYRFANAADRDSYLDRLVIDETVKGVNALLRGSPRRIVASDLSPAGMQALPQEVQAVIANTRSRVAARYRTSDPIALADLERKGLITEPSYPIAKAMIQIGHDIAMANLFRNMAQRPDWVSPQATPDMDTQVPDDKRFGDLAGMYTTPELAAQLKGLAEVPSMAMQAYETLLRHWKKLKTVYNPATHGRNMLGNLVFATFAGNNPLDPFTLPAYIEAARVLAGHQGVTSIKELAQLGVTGGDFASQELAETLATLYQTDTKASALDHLLNIASIGFARRGVVSTLGDAATKLYRLEDDIFKVAAFVQQRRAGVPAKDAAAHVRKWFPYYDQVPTSEGLKFSKRFVMPFQSFMYEAVRVGANAARERPVTFLAMLALPQLITMASAIMLGLDDEELESVEAEMRGRVLGRPVFSALMPFRDSEGRMVQFDMSNINPYADLMGARLDYGAFTRPWWQDFAQRYVTGNPFFNAAVGLAANRTLFFDRPIAQSGMSAEEEARAVGRYLYDIWKPGIAGAIETVAKSRDLPRGTLTKRDPAMTVARSLAGIDMRSAEPSLAKAIDTFQRENDYPVRARFSGDSTPASRARDEIYQAIINEDPERLREAMAKLQELGEKAATSGQVRDLVERHHPLRAIKTEDRARFVRSLNDVQRPSYQRTLEEWKKARARVPALLARAKAKNAAANGE